MCFRFVMGIFEMSISLFFVDSVSRNRALGNWKILRDKVKGSLRIKPLSRKIYTQFFHVPDIEELFMAHCMSVDNFKHVKSLKL